MRILTIQHSAHLPLDISDISVGLILKVQKKTTKETKSFLSKMLIENFAHYSSFYSC